MRNLFAQAHLGYSSVVFNLISDQLAAAIEHPVHRAIRW